MQMAYTPSCIRYNCQELGSSKEIFLEKLPKQGTEKRTSKSLEKNERYNRICRKLQDKSFPAQLAFLVAGEPFLRTFFAFFKMKVH